MPSLLSIIIRFLELKLHESNQVGVRIFWHYSFIFLKSNTSDSSNHGRAEKPELVTPGNSVSGVTGSKPGLFRTPISGGVHSATSAHDLPRPALAVRNLMEQVRLPVRFKLISVLSSFVICYSIYPTCIFLFITFLTVCDSKWRPDLHICAL